MDNIQYITLDVMNNKTNNFVYTKQYDVGREVVFSFTDNGEPISLDGLTVVFSMKKPDGKVVIYSGAENLSVTTTTATLTFTEQMTVLAGKLPYQLSLIDGDENDIEEGTAVIISTVNGYIICDKAAVQNDDIVSTSDGNYVAEATTAHESAESAAQSAKIAQSYAVGGTDYSHDGKSDTMDNAKYYCETVENLYDKLFTATKIILLANGWSNNEQQVTCEGVIADEDEQLIVVRPFGSSVESYVACGVLCTGQARNQLTFKCTQVPTENLDVYVMIQETINGGLSNVIVDGQSVVHGTVAEIDLSGKQDVLTPGDNIQISRSNVISATNTTYTPGNNVQINNNVISATDTTYSIFTSSSNGLAPAPQSQSGKYLKDDCTWDYPEGTTVIANPLGAATEDLRKLQIGDDIFSIPDDGIDLSLFDNWWHVETETDKTLSTSIGIGDRYSTSLTISKSTYTPSNVIVSDSEWIMQGGIELQGWDSVDNQYVLPYDYLYVFESENSISIHIKGINNSGSSISKITLIANWVIPKSGSGGGSGGASYTDVTGTLPSDSTSITLSNAVIDSTKTFEFYTSVYGLNPTAVSVSSGSITLTFPAQQSAVDVKVRVW